MWVKDRTKGIFEDDEMVLRTPIKIWADAVMEQQKDLVRIIRTLTPVAVVKG